MYPKQFYKTFGVFLFILKATVLLQSPSNPKQTQKPPITTPKPTPKPKIPTKNDPQDPAKPTPNRKKKTQKNRPLQKESRLPKRLIVCQTPPKRRSPTKSPPQNRKRNMDLQKTSKRLVSKENLPKKAKKPPKNGPQNETSPFPPSVASLFALPVLRRRPAWPRRSI